MSAKIANRPGIAAPVPSPPDAAAPPPSGSSVAPGWRVDARVNRPKFHRPQFPTPESPSAPSLGISVPEGSALITSRPHRINPILAKEMDATLNQFQVSQVLRKVVRACSIFNPHEGYRSVTPLDAARVNRTIFHNRSVHGYY